jgi:hypothetical protein
MKYTPPSETITIPFKLEIRPPPSTTTQRFKSNFSPLQHASVPPTITYNKLLLELLRIHKITFPHLLNGPIFPNQVSRLFIIWPRELRREFPDLISEEEMVEWKGRATDFVDVRRENLQRILVLLERMKARTSLNVLFMRGC